MDTALTPETLHLAVTVAFMGLAFCVIGNRRVWYLALSLLAINLVATGVYVAVDNMTGEGVDDAAVFHVVNAWQDAGKLWTFPVVRYSAAGAALSLVVLIWIARRFPLPGLFRLSTAMQGIAVVVAGMASLYTAPLSADVNRTVVESRAHRVDTIGLANIRGGFQLPELPPGFERKNLILIYAESMESAFFDERLFPGLTPRLHALAAKGVEVRRLAPAPMSNWTITGMVASQCGVPLASILARSASADYQKLASEGQCLAHVLKHNGYFLSYVGGASTAFGGKGDYYRLMGFDEVLGREELANENEPLSTWGLHDDSWSDHLFERARQLHDLRRPFALLGLTLDTHPPQGFPTPGCVRAGLRYAREQNAHLDAVHCSDHVLGGLIEKLMGAYGRDTVVALVSDHIMMGSLARDALLARNAPRFNHLMLWGGGLLPGVIDRQGSQFDVGATVWQAVSGQSISLGFGRSLLDERATLSEQYGPTQFDDSVIAWRDARASTE